MPAHNKAAAKSHRDTMPIRPVMAMLPAAGQFPLPVWSHMTGNRFDAAKRANRRS
jgi:hypothetical protein